MNILTIIAIVVMGVFIFTAVALIYTIWKATKEDE